MGFSISFENVWEFYISFVLINFHCHCSNNWQNIERGRKCEFKTDSKKTGLPKNMTTKPFKKENVYSMGWGDTLIRLNQNKKWRLSNIFVAPLNGTLNNDDKHQTLWTNGKLIREKNTKKIFDVLSLSLFSMSCLSPSQKKIIESLKTEGW